MRKFIFLLVAALLISTVGALGSPLPVRAAGTLSITPSYYSFGSITVGTRTLPKDFIIRNTGSEKVILGHLAVAGDFRLRLGTCTTGLALLADQTCTFNVSFAPLSIAYRTGTIYIPSDAENPLYTVSINGYGTGTNLLKSPNFDLPLTKPIPWREGPNVPEITNLLDCSVWVSPMCSVRMQGSSRNIRQTISQAVARVGEVGDRYAFILSSKSKYMPYTGIYSLEVELLNTYNQRVGRKVVYFNGGTHNWQTAVGNIKAANQYTWVVFRFTLQQPSGTAWFDNAILVKIP